MVKRVAMVHYKPNFQCLGDIDWSWKCNLQHGPGISVQDWSPHMRFILKGSQIFSLLVEGLVQIQDVNLRIQKGNTKLILNLCMKNMVHVCTTMWKIKNQPSSSTFRSDNALRLLILVVGRLYYRGLQVTSSFQLGLRFEGLFWERNTLKGQIAFEGHWRLQSCTLPGML
jgi:hypothetical protein